MKAFLAGMETGGELSDDELDAVAGGLGGARRGGCFIIGQGNKDYCGCAFVGTQGSGYDLRCIIIGVFTQK